ncbi:serine hydrolase (plasmid) [Cupriavidus basilensis]
MTDLDQFLAEITASGPIPGVSLATLRAGARGPEYHFGIRGAHDNSVVDARTVFEAASLTKPVVAFIALQLAEEGCLDPHQPLFDICGDPPQAARYSTQGQQRSQRSRIAVLDAHRSAYSLSPVRSISRNSLSTSTLGAPSTSMHYICEIGNPDGQSTASRYF